MDFSNICSDFQTQKRYNPQRGTAKLDKHTSLLTWVSNYTDNITPLHNTVALVEFSFGHL